MKLMKVNRRQTLYMILQGGLGNQLFIYFAAKFIEEKYNKKVIFISRFPDRLGEVGIKSENIKFVLPKYFFMVFSITLRKSTFFKVTNKFVYYCEDVGYENLDARMNQLKFLVGYFQTDYYLNNCIISSSILKDVKLFIEENCVLKCNYSQNNSIALHIRRGDYLLEKNSYFGILSYEYYLSSLKKKIRLRNFDKVYLFSDSEIKQEFKNKLKLDFINLEVIDTSQHNIDDVCTLALLSQFPSHIISNSTFSWWGAYLGGINSSVIAPSIWFKKQPDPKRIYPDSWETVESSWE